MTAPTLLAGIVVLAGAWRLGVLHLRQPAEPQPPAPDAARGRSLRLLQAIDEAVADKADMAGELWEFERIVLFSVVEFPGRQYPPPAHDYPRT
ncbi:hypothetical protein [Streptomyces virginiae]|uniref:hypothetical protein n=1 Tax=Streptomyces virginiae TaxID=1961 RepID=UPI00345254E9